MNFVNHEDFEAPLHGLVDGLFQQQKYIVNAPVGRRVQFSVVNKPPAINIGARLAHTARSSGNVALPVRANAVERLGQNA